jgi:hypothetical protein
MASSDENAPMFSIGSFPLAETVALPFVLKLRANLAIYPPDTMRGLFDENKIRAVVAVKSGNGEDADEHLKGTKEVLGKYLRVDDYGRRQYDFRFDEKLRVLKVGEYFLHVRLEGLDDAGEWKPMVGMNGVSPNFFVSKPRVPAE